MNFGCLFFMLRGFFLRYNRIVDLFLCRSRTHKNIKIILMKISTLKHIMILLKREKEKKQTDVIVEILVPFEL